MNLAKFLLLNFISISVSTPASASESGAVAQPANLKAPPQFVLFAFDNCDSPSFWEESLEFAERFETVGVEMKFTYFVSGAYFLTKEKSYHYAGPRHTPGASDIGFAPDKKFVSARIAQINRSIEEAHEIGSHAVGHFEGTRWTEEDWSKEFTLFNHIINNIFFFNQMPAEKFLLNPANIIGFRTPYLSYSSGLWITLNKFNYKYDTSKVSPPSYWPQKVEGIWNFPLAELIINGTAKRTLSMDYNFYVAQSQAREDLQHASEHAQQMYDTYMDYFARNYNGNRAPVHIGHHFKQMNGGAYWRAMKAVAHTVCFLPNVRCATYKELAQFLDSQTPEDLASYSNSRFQKEPQWLKRSLTTEMDLRGSLQINRDQTLSLNLFGRNAGDSDLTLSYLINGKSIKGPGNLNQKISFIEVANSAQELFAIVTASIRNKSKEVLAISHEVTIGDREITLSPRLENRILLGDLPEAHEIEIHPDSKAKNLRPSPQHPSL